MRPAMNLSQIFGLFPDADGAVQAKLDAAVGRALPLQATDHLGVVSKLWPVTDQHVVSAVTGPDGAQTDFHRRRPSPLRDGAQIPRGEAADGRCQKRQTRPPISCS